MNTNNNIKKMFLRAFQITVITEFTQICALLIDSIITTKFLGANEIAAVGISLPFFFIVGLFSSCISAGLQVKCCNEVGKGNLKRVNYLINECLKLGLFLSVIVTVLLILLVPQMAFLFGARGDAAVLQKSCEGYLYGLSFEFLPYLVLTIMTPIVQLNPKGNRAVIASAVAGGIADILLDIISVYLHLGTIGIGLATSLSVVVAVAVIIPPFLGNAEITQLRNVPIFWADIFEIVKSGAPKAMHGFANMLTPLILNTLVITAGGTGAMAVMSVRGSITDFVEIPVMGISAAVMMLIGISYGENNECEMKTIRKLAHRYIMWLSMGIMAVLFVGSGLITRFVFSAEPELMALMNGVMICLIISIPFQFLIVARIGYLQAVNQEKPAEILEMATNLVVIVALSFVFHKCWGIYGIFAAYPVSKGVIVAYIFLTDRVNRKMAGADLCDKDMEAVCEIENLEECCLAGEQAKEFCKAFQMPSETVDNVGILVEDLITNIIRNGFVKRNKKVHVDFRITYINEKLMIRIRDNSSHTGVHLLQDLKENINYYRMYDMNTLVIGC